MWLALHEEFLILFLFNSELFKMGIRIPIFTDKEIKA